jgi:retinoid hydroxylase
MSKNETPANFPPGDQGKPLIGQAFTFRDNEPEFTLRQFRKHGPVFSTTMLGRRVCFLAGAEALEVFYDEANVLRRPSAPDSLLGTTWGHEGSLGLPPIDGGQHRARKRNFLRTTTWQQTDRYLGTLDQRVRAAIADWRTRDRFSVEWEADRAILSAFAEVFFGAPFPEGKDGDDMVRAITENFSVFNGGLPLDLPITAFGRSKRRAEEVLYPFFQQALDSHRASPERFDDAVSLYLAGDDVPAFGEGEMLTDFHQFFIGSYGLTTRVPPLAHDLATHPQVVARLQAEIREHQDAYDAPLTVDSLRRFKYADQVLRETLRIWPSVPVILGQAARDVDFGGYTIPKGTTTFGCLYATCHDEAVFKNADQFDPDRFSPERNEGADNPEFAGFQAVFGAGDNSRTHKCAGIWVALSVLKVIILHLAHGWRWQLAKPDLEIDTGRLPTEFEDGLELTRVG